MTPLSQLDHLHGGDEKTPLQAGRGSETRPINARQVHNESLFRLQGSVWELRELDSSGKRPRLSRTLCPGLEAGLAFYAFSWSLVEPPLPHRHLNPRLCKASGTRQGWSQVTWGRKPKK